MSSTSQLKSAISSNDNETVSKLLEKMDIEAVNRKEDNKTALHVACHKKNHEALDSLLAMAGIDVNVKTKAGLTPLNTALYHFNLQAVAKLLDRPEIDVNVKSKAGMTPLHAAFLRGNLQAVAKLLDRPEIDVNAKSSNCGSTPLHLACRKNLHSIVRKLLASPGIHVNDTDVHGDTPIMDCAGFCQKDALNAMLEDPRVNLDIKDKKERGLEEKVGCFRYSEDKDKCLDMIKNERMRRKNGEVGNEQTSQAESIGRGIIKIEKINKEIVMEEEKSKTNLDTRKRKMEYLVEKQTLDKKILAKKYKEESSLLEKNQRHEITALQDTFAREDHDEQRYIASLTEHRDELAQNIEKLTNDAGNGASSHERSKLEPIKRSLECPVCMELMLPPIKIWMCRFSHVICEGCKGRLEAEGGNCPTCTTEPFIGRNYMAEDLARTVFNV